MEWLHAEELRLQRSPILDPIAFQISLPLLDCLEQHQQTKFAGIRVLFQENQQCKVFLKGKCIFTSLKEDSVSGEATYCLVDSAKTLRFAPKIPITSDNLLPLLQQRGFLCSAPETDTRTDKSFLYSKHATTIGPKELDIAIDVACTKSLLRNFCDVVQCPDKSYVLCSPEFDADTPLVRLSQAECESYPYSSTGAFIVTKSNMDHNFVASRLIEKYSHQKVLVVVENLDEPFNKFPHGLSAWNSAIHLEQKKFVVVLLRTDLASAKLVSGSVDKIILCSAHTLNPAARYSYLLFRKNQPFIRRQSTIGIFVKHIQAFRKMAGISMMFAQKPELKGFSLTAFFRNQMFQFELPTQFKPKTEETKAPPKVKSPTKKTPRNVVKDEENQPKKPKVDDVMTKVLQELFGDGPIIDVKRSLIPDFSWYDPKIAEGVDFGWYNKFILGE